MCMKGDLLNKRQREREKHVTEDFKQHKETEEKVLETIELTDDEFFKQFLRKVDRTSQQELISELFGSEGAYIDTPGDFHTNQRGYEYDIVYCCKSSSDTLIRLYGWYCENWRKAWDWVHCHKKKVSVATKP